MTKEEIRINKNREKSIVTVQARGKEGPTQGHNKWKGEEGRIKRYLDETLVQFP